MIRTRFAPSPTGYLHVGGLRTALYNYLFARKNQGTFLLRIEDTDQKRYVEGALESLLRTFQQIGLDYDEGPEKGGSFGPYIQSQRTELYRQYTSELVQKGAAYHCFCTPERLDIMRKQQTEAKMAPMYDRTCLKLTPEEIETKKQQNLPFVIRQKIPHGRTLKFTDLIRGKVTFNTSTIDDQVLMKSDHFPTYHLANVVDDHLMEISHVIRAEEWLPSTPKHLLLYEAFGWQPPEYAHLPLIVNKDKTKLSKRQGDVSVESYLEKGYTKEALINFIALLGWHPGKGIEEEIFSLEELIELFSLEQVHKSAAVFDLEKLNWFNFQWKKRMLEQKIKEKAQELGLPEQNPKLKLYIELYKSELLLEQCQKYLPESWLSQKDLLFKALITVEEKILKNPAETAQYIRFYFEMPDYPVELFLNPKMKIENLENVKKTLSEVTAALQTFEHFESMEALKNFLTDFIQKLGLKTGQVLWPMRVALTGEQFSPGTYEVLWALGKEESLKRLKQGQEKVNL